MNAYTPAELSAEILKQFREQAAQATHSIINYVTDEQIQEAIAYAIENPLRLGKSQEKNPSASIDAVRFKARIKLMNDFTKSEKFLEMKATRTKRKKV